jgi:hypothetical protein
VCSGDGVDVYLFEDGVQWWGLKETLKVLRHTKVEEFLNILNELQLLKKASTAICHPKLASILFFRNY